MFPVAIAVANAFMLKPSERGPSASLMARLMKEAGPPDAIFNVVQGDKVAVDVLLAHPDVKAVSFAGSTPIANYICETCAGNGKRVQTLGGAKKHMVVVLYADIDQTVDALASAAYGQSKEASIKAMSTRLASDQAKTTPKLSRISSYRR
jgi:malonate-semialdehyde dehydrogenase (acetylating)/methylmalonate-semialdehyde dehydrogenase